MRWPWLLGSAYALELRTSGGDGDRFAGCMFQILMLEKQPMGSSFNEKAYWSMNALLNKAYADRHGYSFTLASPKETARWSKRPAESWQRVPWVQERLKAAENQKCGWLLYMDSSAFIKDHRVPLSRYLDQIFKDQPLDLRTGGIFQWDEKKKLVSDNVFFIQVNGRGEALMNAWRSSSDQDPATRFEAAESGTLTELLMPGKVVTRSARALKLFQATHAQILRRDLADHASLLSQGWGDFLVDTSALAPGLKRRASMQKLRELGLMERYAERLRALEVRSWKVPSWQPQSERRKQEALVVRQVAQAQASTTWAPLVLPEVSVSDEDLEAEEKEIQDELGEIV